MRSLNLLFFIFPFLIAGFLTYKFSIHSSVAIISFFIFLGMAVTLVTFVVFIRQFLISGRNGSNLIDRQYKSKIATVIPVYNEDPKMVRDTALSASIASKNGDVFVLDDSTDEEIRNELSELERINIKVFRRDGRRGYKAGSMNDWLKVYDSNYDLMAVFDVDQRPKGSFFDEVLKHFDDKSVGFVQVPQLYSELDTEIGFASFWQQQPFLRIVMNGRKSSAFSLGSGTIFRLEALREKGFEENTVTEDIATSIDLHSKGWKSVYSDKNLVWYGLPPNDLESYLKQQSRWSLGGFQILPKLLGSNLRFNQFVDYIAGWMFWFKNGPITFFEVLAPIFFLLLFQPFIRIDATIYLLAYFPLFFSTLMGFLVVTRRFYGVKEFFKHRTIELMAFTTVTSSFITWCLRKKRPFIKTPKNGGEFSLKITFPYWIITILLISSVIKGIFSLMTLEISSLWFATLINIFWAVHLIPFFLFGLYMVCGFKRGDVFNRLKLNIFDSHIQ